MGVITGIDLDAARRACRSSDMDETIADALLGACERGAVAAMNEKQGDEGSD
jgi:2C-methyl-D-erythritol 2,4-cyclodiphosphate synthase